MREVAVGAAIAIAALVLGAAAMVVVVEWLGGLVLREPGLTAMLATMDWTV